MSFPWQFSVFTWHVKKRLANGSYDEINPEVGCCYCCLGYVTWTQYVECNFKPHIEKKLVDACSCITWLRTRHHVVIFPEVGHATRRRTGSSQSRNIALWPRAEQVVAYSCANTLPAIRHHRRLDHGPPVQRLFSGPLESSILLLKCYIVWFFWSADTFARLGI